MSSIVPRGLYLEEFFVFEY